ncbi:MAG TPA: hypothetical protein VI461_11545 [Chitinophagaceae bacterium]|nr:hypothetical protein [Chitinophagaceae bacterium]
MKKLLRYKNGDEYIVGGIAGIQPNGIEPVEELDLTPLSDEEFKQLRKNKKNKSLLKKAKKL